MQREQREKAEEGMTFSERAMEFGRKERYKIVGGSWVLSMVAAFALVGRNPYLTGAQKLVQARVYAQGLTLIVLIATAGFEIAEQRRDAELERQGLAPHHTEDESASQKDLWKEMVAAEEERLNQRDAAVKRQEEKDRREKKHIHARSERQKDQTTRKADEGKEDDDEEGPHPIPGKRGEGKMMKKMSDKPDKSAVP